MNEELKKLILKAKEGDEKAFDKIFRTSQMQEEIVSIRNIFKDEIEEPSELFDWIKKELQTAVRKFDKTRGSDFYKFARVCIRNGLQRRMRKLKPAPSLDEDAYGGSREIKSDRIESSDSSKSIFETIESDDALKGSLGKIREIIELMLKADPPLTQVEIADRVNCSTQEVCAVLSIYMRYLLPEKEQIRLNKILLVEDDEEIVEFLENKLQERFQSEVITILTSNDARKILENESLMRGIDIIILDIILPENQGDIPDQREGEELLSNIGKNYASFIPTLVFSSLLNLYENPLKLTKHEIDELIAQFQRKGALRAYSKEKLECDSLFNTILWLVSSKKPKEIIELLEFKSTNGNLTIENGKAYWIKKETKERKEVEFTNTELEILKELIIAKGNPVPYGKLRKMANVIGQNSLKIHVGNINKKLRPFGIEIKSRYGVGYFVSSSLPITS